MRYGVPLVLVVLLGAMPGTVLPVDQPSTDDGGDEDEDLAAPGEGLFSVDPFDEDDDGVDGDEPTAELVAGSRSSTTTEPAAPVVGALSASGIPQVALRAYRAAEATMAVTDPGCGLRWSLVAAIGRVESNHGRFGGSQLRADGTTTRPIRGIPLDGRPGVATIRDTDDGALDGDRVYDRAVGPMQFIPSSWRFAGVDGNGDGREDPNNIFDAALAAAGYLCAGDTDLRDADQRAAAVFRYNRSQEYVAVVLALAEQYEQGVTPLPSPPPAPRPPSPLPSPNLPPGSVTPPPFGREPGPQGGPTSTTSSTTPSSPTTTPSSTSSSPAPSPTTTPAPTTAPSSTATTAPGPSTTTTAPCPTTTTTTTVPDPSSTTTSTTTTTTTTTAVPGPSSTTSTTTVPPGCPPGTSDPSTTTTTTAPVETGLLAGALVLLPIYLVSRRRARSVG